MCIWNWKWTNNCSSLSAGLSVAKIHRTKCTYEFDKFNFASDVAEANRLISFISNTTSDSVLVGASAGATIAGNLNLLNETFHKLGIPDIALATSLFTFAVRPGYPKESDYIMSDQNQHTYHDQFVIIAPFTRSEFLNN